MLELGYYPSELIMREIALIPAHCSMYKELILLDRWMIRLNMIPSLEYLQTIISSSARRSHVEYRKFEQYYREKQLPLPIRTEYSFYDQDPTDSYPFTHAVDCQPESFFDYYLTDLPNKLLLSCKCQYCKHRLSGEEILAGFQNLKISQVLSTSRTNNINTTTLIQTIDKQLNWNDIWIKKQTEKQLFTINNNIDSKYIDGLISSSPNSPTSKSPNKTHNRSRSSPLSTVSAMNIQEKSKGRNLHKVDEKQELKQQQQQQPMKLKPKDNQTNIIKNNGITLMTTNTNTNNHQNKQKPTLSNRRARSSSHAQALQQYAHRSLRNRTKDNNEEIDRKEKEKEILPSSKKRASFTATSSLSIAQNTHLPGQHKRIQQQKLEQKLRNAKQFGATSIKSNNLNGMRRSGQWTTLCPFCSSETVAKIEIFGGLIPDEYKDDLNKFMSFTLMNSNGISRKNISSNNDHKEKIKLSRKTFNLFSFERLHERIQRIV